MNDLEQGNNLATNEQLATLQRLGVIVNNSIDSHLAQISIEFHQATERQLALLRQLGFETDMPITKSQASALISQHRRCHEWSDGRCALSGKSV